MKYLPPPQENDFAILVRLAERTLLRSYPSLKNNKSKFINRYLTYIFKRGNSLNFPPPLDLSENLISALRSHYTSPPAGLEFIEDIRKNGSPDVCPMCGSFAPTELDHVIPKKIYPEYSIFSHNLVPACACNRKKGATLHDIHRGARVLHPYFDKILSQRLAYISLSGDLEHPLLSISIAAEHSGDPSVTYHISNILEKTNILLWAAKIWGNILRAPKSYFPALFYIKEDVDEAGVLRLIDEKDAADEELYKTPNNWSSMLLFGMKKNTAVAPFIANRINGLRDGTITPY